MTEIGFWDEGTSHFNRFNINVASVDSNSELEESFPTRNSDSVVAFAVGLLVTDICGIDLTAF